MGGGEGFVYPISMKRRRTGLTIKTYIKLFNRVCYTYAGFADVRNTDGQYTI